jgi:hypothetical protein
MRNDGERWATMIMNRALAWKVKSNHRYHPYTCTYTRDMVDTTLLLSSNITPQVGCTLDVASKTQSQSLTQSLTIRRRDVVV